MRSEDFTKLYKECGSFNVYEYESNQWYKNECCVKVICPINNDELAKQIVMKLAEMLIALTDFKHNNQYVIRTKIQKTHNHKVQNISAIVWMSQPKLLSTGKGRACEVAAEWLEANCQSFRIENAEDTYDTSKLSVGPCSYKDERGTFVKVRFDGMSLPAYVMNGKLDLSTTDASLLKEFGPSLATKFSGILSQYESVIVTRAKDRPLNLSEVPEYAKHEISYWIKQNNSFITDLDATAVTVNQMDYYHRVPADSPYLSKPGTVIYPVCYYGQTWRDSKCYAYVMIEDELYNIAGFFNANYHYNSYNSWNVGTPKTEQVFSLEKFDPANYSQTRSLYISEKSYFTAAELTKVTDDDMFVKEKAIRTLKAKL